MGLIQNWDNKTQQAKSFQMRYNMSKLNNKNYQTWSIKQMPGIDMDAAQTDISPFLM